VGLFLGEDEDLGVRRQTTDGGKLNRSPGQCEKRGGTKRLPVNKNDSPPRIRLRKKVDTRRKEYAEKGTGGDGRIGLN